VSAQQVERLLVRKFSHMALAAVAVWSRTPAFGSSRPDAEFDHAARPTTSEVYGDPSVHPQSEDYWGHVKPVGPRSCYGEGKRCAETLFFDYWRQHRLPIKIARIFNTYGPRMHPNDGRVVSNFIVQALLGRDITIYGDGTQTRSFCWRRKQASNHALH
jgi:nucleoside-diphosphate-sugar epimerase